MFYTIIGTQWGDEGKGKIVDWLSSMADTVVRFQGGNNAGHTLQIGEKIYKLNLLPSGIIRGKKCIIGNGVILDPWALEEEIDNLKSKGININDDILMIAENICLILPLHKTIDELNEKLRGDEVIGTTKKGIGPAYEDKVGRRAIRLCDLDDDLLLRKKIDNICNYHSIRFSNNNLEINKEDLFKRLKSTFQKLRIFLKPTWRVLDSMAKNDDNIVFEGAQGSLLDIDFGTYPFVTSSNTISGQIFAGTGFNNRHNNKIIGITKAYTTRVGEGPFPTEQKNEIGDYLSNKGKELGTVTLRKRRCGWFDANLVKQSVKISSVNDICLTKLDVLDELNKIKICIGYEIDNNHYDYFPFSERMQKKIKPIYKEIDGWQSSTFGINKWSDLPEKAKFYINEIENIVEKDISIISTGPERSQTIDKKNILKSD